MLKVIPRKITMPIPELGSNSLVKNNPVLSHFFNALSTLFPIGEAFFIASVKPFINNIKDEVLRKSAIDFIEQEKNHSYVHTILNRGLEKYNMKVRYKNQEFRTKKALRFYSSEFNLALTAGMEHLTATIGYVIIRGNYLNNVHVQVADLFYWHSLEELEHKSVVFNLFQEVDGTQWKLNLGMIIGSFMTYITTLSRMVHFLHKDGLLFRFATFKEILNLHISQEGILRKCLPLTIDFFKPNFHPDQRDDFELIADMENKLKGIFIVKEA
ncbi:MAG: metal-dependent hydrolase [Nitrospinae bacterium]|nr:metal-dependent hydrolase [Nitrospinota bacterium]